MQLTLQNVFNHQIQAAEAGFRQLFHDRCDIPVDRGDAAVEVADYERVDFAELIGQLMEFKPITADEIRDTERRSPADLGPKRFAPVKELLHSAWQGPDDLAITDACSASRGGCFANVSYCGHGRC